MHPRRILPPLVLVILVAQAPAALAQDTLLTFSADPASRTVGPGEVGNTTLRLQNRGPFTLRVDLAHDATALTVVLERVSVTLAPGASAAVRANVSWPGVTNATATVAFRATATSDGPVTTPPQESDATFTLNVRPPTNATSGRGDMPDPDPDDFGERLDPPIGGADNGTSGNQGGNATQGGGNATQGGGNATQGGGNATQGGGNATGGGAQPGGNTSATGGQSGGSGPAAQDEGATNSTGGTTNATGGSGAPPQERPAPVLAPEWLDLTAAPRERVGFLVEVRNDGTRAQTFEAILRLPIGWAGALQRNVFDVPAGGSVRVEGSVLPLAEASDGEGSLAVSGAGGTTVTILSLRVDRPLGAAGPQGESGALAEEAQGPLSDATPAATAGVLSLRVEPDEVRVPRGGRALAHLVVANGLGIPLDARPLLAAPEGFRLDAADAGFRVEAGATLLIPLVILADDALPEGRRAEATAYLDGHDAASAPFALLVEPADARPSSDAPPADASAKDGPDAPLVALALAAAGGVTLAAAWAWRRWHLVVFALYARLLPSRVLEHPKRRAIMDVLAAEPGVRLADLQRRLGLANGALRHHVDRLEAAGHLRSVPEGPHRRLYPPHAGRVAPVPGLAERALRAIEEQGPITAGGLAAALGVSRQSLHYHLKKLAAQGRIRATRQGGDLVLALPTAPAAAAAPAPAPAAASSAPRGGPRGPSP